MSHSIVAALALGLALMAGPQPNASVLKPAMSVESSAVALPPELDRVLRDYERAWRAGDGAALASLFAADGFVLQSSHPPIRGRPAIQAAYARQGGAALRLRALAFATNGTIGYIIGTYGFDNQPGEAGKFTLTLQRTPGEPWLIFSDMDNLSVSPQRPSALNTPAPAELPLAGH